MTDILLTIALFGVPTLIVAMIAWDGETRRNRPPAASYRAYEGGRSGFKRTE